MKTTLTENTRHQASRGKFVAIAATYCLGVFNDNYFKQAAMLIAVSVGLSQLQGTATILFALPFILFSAHAGWLADRFPKKKVVVAAKALELLAMAIGAAGILLGSWPCILSMLFLMGLQSCCFGPALNGSIPEIYPESQVPRANATLKLTTTLAILIGIAMAGLSLDQNWFKTSLPFGNILVAAAIVIIALLGFIASFGVHSHPRPASRQKPFPWAGPFRSLLDFYAARKDRQLFLAIIADSFFYFVASLAVLIINTFGLEQLGFSQTTTSFLSMALMLGIGIGSIAAARVTVIENWHKHLSSSALGMAIGLICCGLAPFFSGLPQTIWLIAALTITGICGGLFLIPVTSFIQVRPEAADKGQVIATSGFCSFIGILLSGAAFSFMISRLAPNIAMLLLGGFTLLFAIFFFLATKGPLLFPSQLLVHSLNFLIKLRYRIEVSGLEKVAATNGKGILFLPNHPALIDPVIILSLLHEKYRPRPLVDHEQGHKPFVRWIMKHIDPIFIPDLSKKNGRDDRNTARLALEEVANCLKAGENVILYPAGRLYRSSQEDLAGNSAVEFLLKSVPDVQIVLVRTAGLWGSSFSFAQGAAPSLFKCLRLYLAALLANGIFFGPRRHISVHVTPDNSLKKITNRMAINGHLETYYNLVMQPNTAVPYFWWQGTTPRIMPEPRTNSFAGRRCEVSPAVRQLIYDKIGEISGCRQIKDNHRLANDLGIDSLSLMELAVWFEEEFALEIDDLNSLSTVGDCLQAASGQAIEKEEKKMRPIGRNWFLGDPAKRLVFPSGKTITQAFLQQARNNPKKVIIADQLSGTKTYRQLMAAIFALKPIFEKIEGRHLGIMLPASVSAAIVYLAALFAGKTPTMINWTTGPGNMDHCLKNTGVKQIVTASALHKKIIETNPDFATIAVDWLFIDKIAANISLSQKILAAIKACAGPLLLSKARVQETAAILFTSGSESTPKTVPLSHQNITANMQDFSNIIDFRDDDKLLGMLPPFHSLGLVGTIILPLCQGLKTVYHANPTESLTLAAISKHYKVTCLIGTPTFIGGIVGSASAQQLTSLRRVFTGAEKCPEHVYQNFQAKCPEAVLCEGYGITECSPLVSINHVKNPQPGTIGKILPSIESAIVNLAKNSLVEPGQKGILLVRGPSIFSGYMKEKPGKGFCQFAGKSWYDTGDFVKEDKGGNLIFCGRQKRFIKLGGEMISLPAIENAIQVHCGTTLDNGPAFAIEASPADNHPEIILFTTFAMAREEANRYIRNAGLSPLHNIRRIEILDAIPVLGSGKTDYRKLQERLAA